MEVKVSYNSYLIRKFTKIVSEKVFLKENSSIADLLGYLGSRYGEPFVEQMFDKNSGELKMLLLVNGVKAQRLESMLSDSSRVNILSFTTGG